MWKGAKEIRRFYYIIHPFYHRVQPGTADRKLTEAEVQEITRGWYKTILQVARDKEAVLIIDPNIDIYGKGSRKVARAIGKETGVAEITALVKYARKAVGNRLLVTSNGEYIDAEGRRFITPKAALMKNGFFFYPGEIRTEGMGEYTLQCVFQQTTILNHDLGMPNPVPWKNRQSTILPKKSISEKLAVIVKLVNGRLKKTVDAYYPTPKERRGFIERIKRGDKKAKAELYAIMQKYRATKAEARDAARRLVKERERRRRRK